MLDAEIYQIIEEISDHLDYCGYGDKWEREVAKEHKLPEKMSKLVEYFKSLVTPVNIVIRYTDLHMKDKYFLGYRDNKTRNMVYVSEVKSILDFNLENEIVKI